MRPVYRDERVHVQARMCATCIFRPGNLMRLVEGRVDEMVREATSDPAGNVPCHSTLDGDQAVCRGFWDRHRGATLRLAERMGVVVFVEPGR